MGDYFKINVSITLKDVKAFSFYTIVINKIYILILLGLWTLGSGPIFTFLFTLAVAPQAYKETFILFSPWIFIFIFGPPLALISFVLLLYFIAYRIQKRMYEKDKLASALQCIQLLNEQVQVTSAHSNSCFEWHEITEVKEIKPCFMIRYTRGVVILPRRCFASEAELKSFFNIVTQKVPPSKLKLKGYKLGETSPDYGEVEEAEAIVPIERQDFLGVIQFRLTKKLLFNISILNYYTSMTGIIFTGIGLFCLFQSLNNIKQFSLIILFLGFIGGLFIFYLPIVVFKTTFENAEREDLFDQGYTFKFDEVSFIMEYAKNTFNIRWTELRKMKAYKSYYLLRAPGYSTHIIPKDVEKQYQQQFETLERILKAY